MTVRKFRWFLASNIEKEEAWLTEMSAKGLHFRKNRFGLYYFDEDSESSYIYQIDFQRNVDKAYFQLYKDAGWEPVDEYMRTFHYFRHDTAGPPAEKLYSDAESMRESYRRMIKFYIMIFAMMILLAVLNLLVWQGLIIQKIAVGLVFLVLILYIFLFVGLRKKIKSFQYKQ